MKTNVFTKVTILITAIVIAAVCGCGTTTKTAANSMTVTVADTATLDTMSQISTPPPADTIETVTIGNRTWTKKNLNITVDSSWCYDNDPANCEKYGRLYTWDAAVKLCAGLGDGWRLPSIDEWRALYTLAEGGPNREDFYLAQNRLMAQNGWEQYPKYEPIIGTDDFGFSALPGGGLGIIDADDNRVGRYGFWWSATEFERDQNNRADYFMLTTNRGVHYYEGAGKNSAFSVRCIRDVH